MNWWYYTPTKPIKVRGGIKAHTKRGKFGQTWWARRWTEIIESFDIGERLNRGKSYARKGQVISIKIEKGLVTASVQGSYYDPYKVSIKVKMLNVDEWKKLAIKFFERPAIAAKLLAGQMPADIEKVFEENGLSLFPSAESDLDTDCNCLDWSNPCKHIAAVYFLLGEEFDRDPFLMFKLRGAEREEILNMAGLGQTRKKTGPAAKKRGSGARSGKALGEDDGQSPEPLPANPGKFWNPDAGGEQEYNLETVHPSTSVMMPKRLGNFPFWRGEDGFIDILERMYGEASQAGLRVFAGELGNAGDKPKKTSKRT